MSLSKKKAYRLVGEKSIPSQVKHSQRECKRGKVCGGTSSREIVFRDSFE